MNNEIQLSPKQTEFIDRSTAKLNLCHGAVRSGKTLACIIRFAQAVILNPDEKNVIIGRSIDSIEDNIVKPMMNEIFPSHCTYEPGNRFLYLGTKQIRIIGAADASAVGRIQGSTISTCLVDEMTILPSNFIDMLLTRLSEPHSILFGSMNPDSPIHPMKKLIDSADNKNVYALGFNLRDNPSLTPEYLNMLEAFYSGLWYKRYILGEWCLAEGSVYDQFNERFHVIPRAPSFAKQWIAGIDVGSSNPFACILIGYDPDGMTKLWAEKEYYFDPVAQGRQKTNSEFAQDLEQFLYGYPITATYIDPSAEAMQVELKKRRMNVRQGDNSVADGISRVSSLITSGDLKICSCCTQTIKEFNSYVWDPKKTALGYDEPIKKNDHCLDAIRYAIYTHFGKRDPGFGGTRPKPNPRGPAPMPYGFQNFMPTRR